jgi:hypothetical protein
VQWEGPFDFVPTIDTHITPRLTGRFLALRVESDQIGDWALGGISLQFEAAGDR